MEPAGKVVAGEKRPNVQFAVVKGRVHYRCLTGGKKPTDWTPIPRVSKGREPVQVPVTDGYGVVMEFMRIDGAMAMRFRLGDKTGLWWTAATIKTPPTAEAPYQLLVPWIA
jgi:hypothetical protein